MSERFYASSPLAVGPFTLEGPEARHLAAVSRVRVGDAVYLFNGDGLDYHARVVAVGKREVEFQIERTEPTDRELSIDIEIAAALPKGDRAQFLIEKLTELGVRRFVPLQCRRSVVQAGEGKRDKLQRYVIEASKQCGRSVLMEVSEAADFSEYVKRQGEGVRWIAHPGPAINAASMVSKSVRVLIGPEGGFTEDEVALALQAGWTPVSFGNRILRIETAAIMAAVVASAQCEGEEQTNVCHASPDPLPGS